MNDDRLTCKELVELVTDYLDRALPPNDLRRFETHLRRCQGCTTYFEQFQQTIKLMGRLTEDSLSNEAREELLRLFRDWKQRE